MKKALRRFRDAGSFIAGILVGLSVVVPVIALTGANTTASQTFLVFGAPNRPRPRNLAPGRPYRQVVGTIQLCKRTLVRLVQP
jgi:hypothetical protein